VTGVQTCALPISYIANGIIRLNVEKKSGGEFDVNEKT
jgi:hypothetical protein